jgi:hypothetical protein
MSNYVDVLTVANAAAEDMGQTSIARDMDNIYRWAVEAQKLIGYNLSFPLYECVLNVQDYRAPKPANFLFFKGFQDGAHLFEYSGKNFTDFTVDSPYLNTRTAQLSYGQFSSSMSAIKFVIQGYYFHFDGLKEGNVGVAYRGVQFDKNGLPMVLALNQMAVKSYFIKMWISRNLWQGKAGMVTLYQLATDEWERRCDQARVSAITVEEIRLATSINNSLLPSIQPWEDEGIK